MSLTIAPTLQFIDSLSTFIMNRIIYHTSLLSLVSLLFAFPTLAQATPPETPADSKITAVSQLADVQPTDWAFQALQSLIERYGIIAGYPDKTFHGNRAMSRYEFAAGLNAALDRVNELLQAGLTNKVSRDDLAILQRLQTEFQTELTSFRNRVDRLDAQTATLEKQQFSTTTKLHGESIFAINARFTDQNDANAIFINRSRLNLETSFTGKDRLLLQLQAGSGQSGDAASTLQNEGNAFRDRLISLGEAQIQARFEQIFFPLSDLGVTLKDLDLSLADLSSIDEIRDKYTGVLATLDLEAGASSEDLVKNRETLLQAIKTGRNINRFLQKNSALDYAGSSSSLQINRLSYTFPLAKDLQISVFSQGYLSDYVDKNHYANNQATNFSTFGLINNQLLLANDAPGAGAAITYNPNHGAFTFRAAYRAEQTALNPTSSPFSTETQGGLLNAPNLGVLELEVNPSKTAALRLQYSRGIQGDRQYEAAGANLEVALGKHIGLFGRFGYAFNFPGDIQAIGWSAGLVFPDLFKQGNLAGLAIGQPLVLQNDSTGIFNATQTNYEAFYHAQINDHIAFSPSLQVITHPGNLKADPVITATLKTIFTF
ncbi:MAG: hypothetical protein B0A82_08865 [Alkalinema sp. CACIAM 70d]|nr:MAG: hypothetical protein B0A82_08865 [Alkalinema sp. CACIAM 70d]